MAEKLYFLYARVSKDDYLESLETQLSILRSKADDPRNNYKYSPETILGEDESGSAGKRSKFDRMISLLIEDSKKPVRNREFEGVMFFKLDRLFRNPRDFHLVENLMDAGYKFVSATETIENTPTGRLLFRMLAWFAIYESDKLSNRVSLTYLTNALKNQFESLGGRLIIGYRMEEIPDSGGRRTLKVVPEERNLINFIYTLRANDPNITAKEIFSQISQFSLYCETIRELIESRQKKSEQSRIESGKKREKIRKIVDDIRGFEPAEDSAETYEEADLIFAKGEDFETSAIKIVNKCLYNDSTYSYDGHFTKTFQVNDELIQWYLKYISALEEGDYELEFKNNNASWDKGEVPIWESVTFRFFIPELVIVESGKYIKVQESIRRKDKGIPEKPTYLTLFEWLLFTEDGDEQVMMNSYLSAKWTVNYRRHVRGKPIEKSELIIEKSIRKSGLFDNREHILEYKDRILGYLDSINKQAVTRLIRQEKMRVIAYEREAQTCENALYNIIKAVDSQNEEWLFGIMHNEIATYRALVKEGEENIREIQAQSVANIAFFFSLLVGKTEELRPEERRLAYFSMFERMVMSLDKERLTIHLRQFMADILWVPKEYVISLT